MAETNRRHPELLAAVHGIALAVRAGASGRVYRWAVSAVAVIGVGAFAVSFLALRDLMQAIGYSSATAWIFPAIIDTAVAVSTLMLVALGDKPARRASHRDHGRQYTKSSDAAGCAEDEKPQVTRVRSAQSACTDGASRPRNRTLHRYNSARRRQCAQRKPTWPRTTQTLHQT